MLKYICAGGSAHNLVCGSATGYIYVSNFFILKVKFKIKIKTCLKFKIKFKTEPSVLFSISICS